MNLNAAAQPVGAARHSAALLYSTSGKVSGQASRQRARVELSGNNVLALVRSVKSVL